MHYLLCRYDLEHPCVVAAYPEGAAVDWTDPSHASCVLVPYPGDISASELFKVLGKAGPEPGLLGDPPTGTYPSHAELDEAGVPPSKLDERGNHVLDNVGKPLSHPLRVVAGQPYPDNRHMAPDVRRPNAPSQALPEVQKAYASYVRWVKEVGGMIVEGARVKGPDDKLVGFPAYTTRETRSQTEADASRAARDLKFTKRVKGTDGVFYDLDAAKLITIADAVSDHVQACFDAEAKLLADIEAGKVKDFGPIDAAFAAID